MVVSELMTPAPVDAPSTWTVRQAVECLYENDIRHLPIVEEGVLIGVVSDRDVQRALSPEIFGNGATQEALAETLSAVMHRGVVFTHPEENITEAIELMVSNRIGALPVVDPSTTQLVGMLSYVDVLRAASDAL